MVKVVILAWDPATRAILQSKLKSYGIQFEVTSTVAEMRRLMAATPFNGLILDVIATVKASLQDKIILQELCEHFPTLRLRWDTREQCFRGLSLGNPLDRDDPIGDFLDKICRVTPGRTFREHKRFSLNFNILLSREADFPPDKTEKSVTIDISLGGCFVFSTGDWENVDHAWVRFLDFTNPTPFRMEIRHFTPWGKGKSLPGIGGKFINLLPGQKGDLHRHLECRPSLP